MPVRHRRETEAGTLYNHRRRTDQRPAGRPFYHRLSLGTAGRGRGYRHRPVCGRHSPAALFRPAEHQPAAAYESEIRWRGIAESLRQRFLGTDEQHIRLHRQHALQYSAVKIRRRRRRCRLWCADVCQYDLSGRFHRLLRRRLPGDRLPQRRRQLRRVEGPVEEELYYNNRFCSFDVCCRTAAGRAAFPDVRRLRPGTAYNDVTRLLCLLLFLPLCRIRHLRLRLLYGAGRRPYLRPDLLSADPGLPDLRSPAPAADLGP